MQNNAYNFLKFIGLDDEDSTTILKYCPGILSREVKEMAKCIAVLTAHGFPKSEIPFLLILNPNILLKDSETIAKNLSKITGNIEDELFRNPYIS